MPPSDDANAWASDLEARFHREYGKTAFSAAFFSAENMQILADTLRRAMAPHLGGELLELDDEVGRRVLDFANEQSNHVFSHPTAEEANRMFVARFMRNVLPNSRHERRHARFIRELQDIGGELFHRRRVYVRGDIERPVESTQRHIGTDLTDYMLQHPYGNLDAEKEEDPSAPSMPQNAGGSSGFAYNPQTPPAQSWWPDVHWSETPCSNTR